MTINNYQLNIASEQSQQKANKIVNKASNKQEAKASKPLNKNKIHNFLDFESRLDAFYAENKNCVVLRPVYVKLTGDLHAAIFLSHLLFWSKIVKKTNPKRRGWFYKTGNEFIEEACLSRRHQTKAKNILGEKGLNIIEFKNKGVPCRTFYRINEEVLLSLIDKIHRPANKKPDKNTTKQIEAKELNTTIDKKNKNNFNALDEAITEDKNNNQNNDKKFNTVMIFLSRMNLITTESDKINARACFDTHIEQLKQHKKIYMHSAACTWVKTGLKINESKAKYQKALHEKWDAKTEKIIYATKQLKANQLRVVQTTEEKITNTSWADDDWLAEYK